MFYGCLNTTKVIKVEYMTPHGNELFYYGDNNEFDNYVDEILVFSTLKNVTLVPVIPKIEMEFWVGSSPPIYIDNDEYQFVDMKKMQSKAKWTKVLNKAVKKIKILKPYETRKILVTRLNMSEVFKKIDLENEYVVSYKTIIKLNNLEFESILDGYIGY
jgi:hypothetical protein